METVTYEGRTYRRVNARWVDSSNFIVNETLQRELNHLYLETLDYTSFSVEELIEEGDKLRDGSSYRQAIIFYEKATADCDESTLKFVLPRITSCYRKCNMPRSVIDLFTTLKRRFGEGFITPVLLTSVAAAYCDLQEYDNALRCCKWAYKNFGGKSDPNLIHVWARIKKESGLE